MTEIQKVETLRPDSNLTPVQQVTDMIIKCVDCGNDFVFTAGNQVYFADKGMAVPKRCDRCRLKRRTAIQRDSIEIKDQRPENT